MHSKVNETIARMEHDHPGWKVWVIYPATDGVLWCARLAEVRAVLAEFDWEFDDRQLALERIERIVTAGQS